MDFNWLSPKAKIQQISGKGMGSFAIDVIFPGETIASFGGFVVKFNKLKNYSEERVSRSLQLTNDLYLLSGKKSEAGDMINHSCDPNCGVMGTSTIIAIKK